ncbi:MAG: hypothetical protein AVDCRST_MAG68-2209 [uncultured Gemmatimonadetes bacterium]|uniref:Uncharacterized protein n=1 Tax=uncultured Gemmatimonadota bacterium TaxID=203437 RepID=A0A6J4L8G9_9BACT|nr:MAG: hypothetical protein AVDCRST_MAG68-2209 [uncultured Gemmatimonadota bacterium]
MSDDVVFQGLPLTGDAGDAFVAIAALLEAAYVTVEEGPGFEEEAFALASRLVARARGAADAPTDAQLRMEALERSEAAAAVVEPLGFELPESLDGLAEELVLLTEAVVREAALEVHTHDAYLALQGDTDTMLLVVVPVSVAEAHVWLLGSLLERVEMGIEANPLRALERAASGWWFLRSRGDDELTELREQEWSLAERPTAATGRSFVAELVADEEAMAALPPRQRHLARQLLQSVSGSWRVRERTGDDAVFVSLADESEYRVREHEAEYGADAVAVGRLVPLDDETWLRSPGMHIGVASEPAAPRPLPPARSASEARKVLAEAGPILKDVEPDEVISAWLEALTRMARKGTGGNKSKRR